MDLFKTLNKKKESDPIIGLKVHKDWAHSTCPVCEPPNVFKIQRYHTKCAAESFGVKTTSIPCLVARVRNLFPPKGGESEYDRIFYYLYLFVSGIDIGTRRQKGAWASPLLVAKSIIESRGFSLEELNDATKARNPHKLIPVTKILTQPILQTPTGDEIDPSIKTHRGVHYFSLLETHLGEVIMVSNHSAERRDAFMVKAVNRYKWKLLQHLERQWSYTSDQKLSFGG